MSEIYRDDRDVRREAGDDVRRSAERLEADARHAAEDVGARAEREVMDQAERAKTGAASEMSGIADALRTAAREMRSGSPQERTFGQIAESLAGASDALRDRDLGELAGDVSDFARRNPVGFLGGAALAGFAATRFAQASARPRGQGDAGMSAQAGSVTPAPAAGGSADPVGGSARSAPARDGAVPARPAPVPATPTTPGDH